MNRTEFKALCNTHNLDFDADRRSIYAFIRDEADFASIKSLLANGCGYLVCASRKAGQAGISYTPHTRIIFADDAQAVARAMADRYAQLLDEVDTIDYCSAEHLVHRDQALKDNPALDGESAQDHLDRVIDESDYYWFPHPEINEAGHWDTEPNSLVFSDEERQEGLWTYSYDQTYYHVVLVLNDEEENEEEDEDAA